MEEEKKKNKINIWTVCPVHTRLSSVDMHVHVIYLKQQMLCFEGCCFQVPELDGSAAMGMSDPAVLRDLWP